jgi:glycosyltransferase involved in cell wall biosynthesis
MTTQKRSICFVTEVDLDTISGAVVNDFKMVESLREFGEVDVIYLKIGHCKSIVGALFLYIWQIFKSISKPYTIYFSRGLISSLFLVALRPFFHKKIVHLGLSVPFVSSEVYQHPHSVFESIIRYCVFRFLEHNLLPKMDAITVATEENAAELVKIGVEKDRVWVIPFWVEDVFFNQPINTDVRETFTFGYVGRFYLYHELESLVKAFELVSKSIADVELLLVGDGVSRPNVEKEVNERKLSQRIHLLGVVPHPCLPLLLSRIHCFILLSRASGIPIALLEAAACGKPMIAFRRAKNDVLNRYFMHGKNIYLVNEISLVKIARAMKLLYTDSELRKTLAYGARKAVIQNFSEKAVIHQLQCLIDNVSRKLYEQRGS